MGMIPLTIVVAGPRTNWERGPLDIPIALGMLGAVVILIGLAIYFIARR